MKLYIAIILLLIVICIDLGLSIHSSQQIQEKLDRIEKYQTDTLTTLEQCLEPPLPEYK